MMRLSAIVLERDARATLRELGRLRTVQLTCAPSEENPAPLRFPDYTREIARCDRLRSRLTELRRTLDIKSAPPSPAPAEMTLPQAECLLAELERMSHDLASRREGVLRRSDELDHLSVQIRLLSNLNTPLDEIGRFEFLHFVTGSMPEKPFEHLTVEAAAVFLPQPIHQGRVPLVAVTTKSRGPSMDNTLKRAGFHPEKLPPPNGRTAEQWLAEMRRDQDENDTELGQLQAAIESLAAQYSSTLAGLEVWVDTERQLLQAEQSFARTQSTVLITGWTPKAAEIELRKRLSECTHGRCVLEVRAPTDVPEKDIPVLLRHSRLLRPFEMLITAYGLPKYRELAPTLFVAISYVLMFGMMFGDVGHGFLLALAGLGVKLKSRTAKGRDLGTLLLFNGLASAVFGAVYGSYFGVPQLKEHALWRDPLEGQPIALMRLAMGAGVVLMSCGLVLNILNRLRHQEWIEGVLGKFGIMGVVFYWGAIVLVAKAAAIRAQGWWSPALVAFLGMPVLCWAIKDPLELFVRRRAGASAHDEGMMVALTESLVGAFEGVMLYLANTVSFVRLAAYAMSHAALLMAAFTLASEVSPVPGVGPVLSGLVVVLGNLAAMLLEGIVASVQALRLEYYEFFGKFFSGEGQSFQPFSLAAPRT